MKTIEYWVLCATDADAKYIKQNDDGCLAMFAEEETGLEIEGITPNTKLHKVEYVKLGDYQALRNELEALKDQVPTIENGKNRYGLDVSYFRNLFNRELNRSLRDFRPDELARVLARASRTADKDVMLEPEFINQNKIKADAVNLFVDDVFNLGDDQWQEMTRKEFCDLGEEYANKLEAGK